MGLRECRLGRGSSEIKICSQLNNASSNAAVGICVGLRGGPSIFELPASSVASALSPVVRVQGRDLLTVRRMGRRVREALLNLPPYPPSVRVLLRVQGCFQSLLIQSEVLSPSA